MNWKDQYRAALVENNPASLLSLIHETEIAMSMRSESLPAATTQELEEMNDATCTLRILKSHAQEAALGSGLEASSMPKSI